MKKILAYVGIILFFAVLSYAFVPQVLGGKVINQSDTSGWLGMVHEVQEWNAEHPDDPSYWTGSMFSGMPTATITSVNQGDWTQKIYNILTVGKRPASDLFVALLGAFLLMLSLGINGLLAVGGAIAVAFCSYNMQIIQVGHNTKMMAIAFLPWVLAACIFTYRSALEEKKRIQDWLKTCLGAVLFAFALSLQIKANHQQISYYLALLLIVFAASLFVWIVSDKDRRQSTGRFFIASALLLILGVAGIATNSSKLVPLYKYTEQSMRGGSELASASNSASGGLELDYATAWSYGWEEIPNLLIPNFNGGSSSGAVNINKSATYDLLKQAGQSNAKEVCKNLPLYWGPQPFTAGPMYMGAITIFLFILGLFFCENKDKWWLVIGTVLAIFLGLGSHFMAITKFFYDCIPFYNKFRTVSMSIILLQVTLPALGFLALDRILKGEVRYADFKKKGLVAYAIAGGFCLVFFLIPGLAGSFTGSVDNGQQDIIVAALQSDRAQLLRSDALRSFLLISASFLLIMWGYLLPKGYADGSDMAFSRRRTAMALVCLLVLVDLFTAGKRYLNSDDFLSSRNFTSQFDKRPVDEFILADDAPSYRILDLTVSPFNDSHPSYWHKNIGGYNAAKIQRYQELIDSYLTPEINSIYQIAGNVATIEELGDSLSGLQTLSLLNMKYLILGEDMAPAVNPGAFGNAWFVDSAVKADSPDDALESLGKVDLRRYAVLEPSDAEIFERRGNAVASADSLSSIELTDYAPNELRYHYSISSPEMAVFSEVYFPEGWHAWIEDTGEDVPVFRADWILRGAVLPAGEHDLIMRYDPKAVSVSATVARSSSLFLIVILLLSAAGIIIVKKQSAETEQ